MSIKIQAIEEALSVSYVSAVVSKAGHTYDIIQRDYGVDISIRKIDFFNGQQIDMGAVLDCQLKSTINWSIDDTHIIYDMEAPAYNKLIYRSQNGAYPCLLVLLCLPRDSANWVLLNEEKLELRKCCYWMYLSGNPTENTHTIRIRVPRSNTFTPDAIPEILSSAMRDEL
ncbi:DUF4365 domain-containing protein [Leptospira langatensis]|uniref:DUF4365 domain-containing protein n=1 Tax=Leptospira langatensis TaxID=2484983 RepID=A0A5F1ZPL3_9LEPT|nr:DUF4365 domain-containing protein [Leptospira langatensis]TGK01813.1 DUF4365 domain-containing protein [Leptospira langatensis]TGL39419.1 DUF4365 domain-containing protein [Leptospira langatensis]